MDAFGALRSLMQRPTLSPETLEQVFVLAERAALTDPISFHETCLPYLRSFPRHWTGHLLVVSSPERLALGARLLPDARFSMCLPPQDLEGSALETLEPSQAWSALDELELSGEGWALEPFEVLLNHPDLRHLKALSLNEGFFPNPGARRLDLRHAEVLTRATHLTSLRDLTVWGADFGDEAVAMLTTAPFFGRLRLLRYIGVLLGTPGVQALCDAWPKGLTTLSLAGNWTSDACAQALARQAATRSLEHLDLSMSMGGLSGQGLATLMDTPHLRGLRSIDLQGTSVTDLGVWALANAQVSWHKLGLYGVDMTLEGVHALAGSSSVSALQELDISGNALGEDLGALLATSSFRSGVQGLGVSSTQLGSRGARCLFSQGPWPELRRLRLRGNDVAGHVIQRWVREGHLARVERVDLSRNPIGDEGSSALSTLTNLRELSLRQCGIGPEGAEALAASNALRHLTRLELSKNPITARGRHALATSPHLRPEIRRQFEST